MLPTHLIPFPTKAGSHWFRKQHKKTLRQAPKVNSLQSCLMHGCEGEELVSELPSARGGKSGKKADDASSHTEVTFPEKL